MGDNLGDEAAKDFLVIGAGLPRTGTLSLMYALEILLPGKCHHGMKMYRHEKEWCDILQGKMSDEEFKHFFLSNGYVAGVDAPFYLFYEQAMRVFPNAKVLLSVRDPQSWIRSYENTVFPYISPYCPLPHFLHYDLFRSYLSQVAVDESLQTLTGKCIIELSKKNEKYMKKTAALAEGNGVQFFNEYVAEVEANVPKEKLIKFCVKEGWGPLCAQLNVPVPDVPFPRANSTEEFLPIINKMKRRSWLVLYELISIPLLSFGVYKLTH